MQTGDTPFQLLYVSQLAPGYDFSVVRAIAKVAREKNSQHDISGALLFDGERFAQLLEGAEADVRAIMTSIEGDTRHADLVVLSALEMGPRRLLPRWVSGYCEADQLTLLTGATPLRGIEALDVFMSVLATSDVE
jgi:Sensors of blue-light using FAD